MLLFLLACLSSRTATDTDPAGPSGEDCLAVAPSGAFALDPSGPDTQIHVHSAFDGEWIWLAWNRPGTGGAFEVFVSAIGCDGGVRVEPFAVSSGPDNQIDPALAIRDDRVLVAWQSDNGQGSDNLDVRLRLLDRVDGAPLGEVMELEPSRDGVPFTGSAWMASVATTDQGYVLAMSAAVDGGFRILVTDLDPDGFPVGDAREPLPDPLVTQQVPQVAMDASGVAHVVFDGEGERPEAWYSVDGAPAVSLGQGRFPAVAPEGPFVAFSDGDVWFGPAESPAPLGPGGGGLALASAGTGGFVGWLRNLSGLANAIRVARFDADGTVSERVDLGTVDAAPYGWNLTPITDDTVFVAWQGGTSPAFRIRGAFVSP